METKTLINKMVMYFAPLPIDVFGAVGLAREEVGTLEEYIKKYPKINLEEVKQRYKHNLNNKLDEIYSPLFPFKAAIWVTFIGIGIARLIE